MKKVTSESSLEEIQSLIDTEGVFWDKDYSRMIFGKLYRIEILKGCIKFYALGDSCSFDSFKKMTKEEFEAM